jgi:hypothetical protein
MSTTTQTPTDSDTDQTLLEGALAMLAWVQGVQALA